MKSNLTSIKIENFRSIQMTEDVKILPITVLIGRNSAGKSTFARSFPLVRQSCEAKKRAPILWFGDRVDFGSFDESLRKQLKGKGEIAFTFGLDIIQDTFLSRAKRLITQDETNELSAKVELKVVRAGKRPSQALSVKISALGFDVNVQFTESSSVRLIECGNSTWYPEPNDVTEASYSAVLPRILFIRTREDVEEEAKSPRYDEFLPFSEFISDKVLESKFSEYRDMIFNLISNAPVLKKGRLADHIFRRLPIVEAKRALLDRKDFDNLINSIEDVSIITRINEFLEFFDLAINDYYSGVKYIEPLRATAQRYYRKQELAIDEIDSKGENLAMFLDNIAGWRLEQFNLWTMKNFGFSAKTKNEGGHSAIVIKERDSDTEANLTDIGFGFSQILPVITQIWLSTNIYSNNSNKTTCLVIEQPELHLHPSFQAKLADVFAAAVSGSRASKQRLIIETHSNHIVSRLGQLISKGVLENKDVQILIFEKNEKSSTTIRTAGFDKDGYLTNWPVGFFEPEA